MNRNEMKWNAMNCEQITNVARSFVMTLFSLFSIQFIAVNFRPFKFGKLTDERVCAVCMHAWNNEYLAI